MVEPREARHAVGVTVRVGEGKVEGLVGGVRLRDGGRSCPLLVGSRRGLSYVNKFFPKDEPETIASLAKRLSRRPTVIQTTLCAYHKYVKVWNLGIRRWYKPLRGKTVQCWAQRRHRPESQGR